MNTTNEDRGLHCPQCNFKIKFAIQELLISNKITCPGCSLEMGMEVPGELKIHLQEIQRAQDMVAQAKKTSF